MNKLCAEEKHQLALRAVSHPVFIVGTMRSGTGFLGLRLNDIPTLIGCPFELRKIWSQTGCVPMASDIQGQTCPQMYATDADRIPLDGLKQAFAREVEKNIGNKHWSRNLRFLNKNPHLCNKIDLVKQLFPDARFIWTLRDMNAVVCSLKNLFNRAEMCNRGIQHIWPEHQQAQTARCFSVHHNALFRPMKGGRIFPGGNITYLAEYWLESNLSLLEFYRRQGPEHICPVPQEQVLNDPLAVANRLTRFLHLEADALCSLPERIDRDAIGHWKSPLSGREQQELGRFCSTHAGHLAAIDAVLASL